MTTFAMCSNYTCPHRVTCLRYRARPSDNNQVYGHFELNSEGKCTMYWEAMGWNSIEMVPVNDADNRHKR